MAYPESGMVSGTEQRLPSRRPIDKRWDRSRNLLLSSSQQNAIRDFRWSMEDPIIFAETPSTTRNYALPPGASLGSKNRNVLSNAATRQDEGYVSNPNRISSKTIGLDEVVRQQAQDNSLQKMQKTLKQKEEQVRNLERKLEKLSSQELSHEDLKKLKEAEAGLRVREAKLAREKAEAEANLAKERAEVEKNSKDLRTEKANFDSTRKAAELAATNEATRKANEAVEEMRELARQKDMEAATQLKEANALRQDASEERALAVHDRERQMQMHDAALQRLTHKSYQEVLNHKKTLDKENEEEVEEAIRFAKEAVHRREDAREDYEAYHQIWVDFWDLTHGFHSQIDSAAALIDLKYKCWKDAAREFRGNSVHSLLSEKYPALHRQVTQYLDSNVQEASNALATVKSVNPTLGELRVLLKYGSHISRQFTIFHRYKSMPSSFDTSILVQQLSGGSTLRRLRESLDRSRALIKWKMKAASTKREREILNQKDAELASKRVQLTQQINLSHQFGQYEALIKLKSDPAVEKRMRLATMDVERWLSEIATAERELGYKIQGRWPDWAVELRERHRLVKQGLTGYQQLERKRWLLQTHLGEVAEDDGRFDADIEKEIAATRQLIYRALSSASGGTGSRRLELTNSSRTAPSEKTLLPPPAIPTPRPNLPVTVQTENRINALRIKLDRAESYSSDEARAKDRHELEELRLKIVTLNLANLRHKRDVLKTTKFSDPYKLANVGREIAMLERKLKGSRPGAPSSPESGPVDQGLEQPRSRRRTHRERRASRVAKQHLVASSGDSSGSSTSPSDEQSNAHLHGAALNFRETKVQQAQRPFWPDYSRYFHAKGAGARPISETSNATSSSTGLDHAFEDAVLLSQALQPRSLPSARVAESRRHVTSQTSESSDESDSLMSAFTNDLDEAYEPSQSTMGAPSHDDSAPSSSQTPESDASVLPTASMEFEDAPEILPAAVSGGTAEADSGLAYQISAEDYRNVALASKNTNASFWSYKLYKNEKGKCPSLHYCTNYETSEAQAKQFVNETVLGFDIEWECGATLAKNSPKDNVSLIQIASEDKIALFQIALFKGDTAEQLMPPTLRSILESRDTIKAGVNIAGDATRLQKCFNVQMTALFELSHLYKVTMYSESEPENINKKPFKLADQVQNILLLPLKKDQVRTSAWSKRLRIEQTEYAASDAYAGFRLFHALEARRKRMDPMPPRPAFYEEKKPLVLGDGRVVVPRKAAPKKKVVQTDGVVEEEENEDEDEEYFDAVETLDTYELDTSLTGGVPLAGLTVAYPTLPPLEISDTVEQQQEQHQAVQPPPPPPKNEETTTPPTKPSKRPPSPQVTAADTWLHSFRSSLPPSSPSYPCKLNPATLRAYHLWHTQNFSCQEVAALLRDPPLSVQTVASYVMQAINEDGGGRGKGVLEWDEGRAVEVLGILPRSVRGRYWRVVERFERDQVGRGV